jgi:hypothetical protein
VNTLSFHHPLREAPRTTCLQCFFPCSVPILFTRCDGTASLYQSSKCHTDGSATTQAYLLYMQCAIWYDTDLTRQLLKPKDCSQSLNHSRHG